MGIVSPVCTSLYMYSIRDSEHIHDQLILYVPNILRFMNYRIYIYIGKLRYITSLKSCLIYRISISCLSFGKRKQQLLKLASCKHSESIKNILRVSFHYYKITWYYQFVHLQWFV